MKIKFGAGEYKTFLVSEVPVIKSIQAEYKEVDIVEMARRAMNIICKGESFKFFEPTAVIARNCRVKNFYENNSGDIDVWIEFVAFNSWVGCYECGVYLSDVLNIWDGTDKDDFENNMYVRRFLPDLDKQ